MEAGNWIALLSLVLAVVVFLTNGRKDTRGDAAQSARLEAKVDGIASNVSEIRVEIRTMQNEVKDHGQRIVAVESSTKSAHHRLDELEHLVHKVHPPEI